MKYRFTFADLFSGIGGIRVGLERLGGTCVYSCDNGDGKTRCRETYKEWFGAEPEGFNVEDIDPKKLPKTDVLAAGLPCPPYSRAGKSKLKSLGRPVGMYDPRGMLFREIVRLAKESSFRPPIILIENVKDLMYSTLDDGRKALDEFVLAFKKIGYRLVYSVVNAHRWVPQNRERLIIVGFDMRRFTEEQVDRMKFPNTAKPGNRVLSDILSPHNQCLPYMLGQGTWDLLVKHKKEHEEKGDGFGYTLADENGISRTLTKRYHKDGSEILVWPKGWARPRMLTPQECCRLMGFGERKIIVADTPAYMQFGNAVVPAVIQAVAEKFLPLLGELK